jgi:hypothetical protein
VGFTSASAQQGSEPSGTLSPEYPPLQQPSNAQIIGDDPDEDGYQGPIPMLPSGAGESSDLGVEPGIYKPNPQQPLQPDDIGYAESPQAWSDFHYIYAAGTTLKPRVYDSGWQYDSGGCTYVSSDPGDVLNLHLDVPNGAWVEYLRIYYKDSSDLNSQAWLTTYNGAGTYSDLITVTSASNTGYGTSLSLAMPETTIVDNMNNAYVFNWRPYITGTTMELCGLRLAYHLPTP